MEKRFQQKPTRDIPTSQTSRSKSFDVQRSSLQPKDAELSRPQDKPEAARASPSNPNDHKQTRDIPTSKTSRPKSFDAQRSSHQAKDAEPSRPQNKPEAARSSTSNPKDLKSKSSKHSASRPHDAILQVNQTIWQKQQHGDHSASNSRQRQNSSAQLGWRQAMRRYSSSMSSLGWRSFNPSLRRKLAGGGDPDDSSSQQQPKEDPGWPIGFQKNFLQATETYQAGNNFSESQKANDTSATKLTNEQILALYPSPSMDEVWNSIEKRGTYR